MKKKENSGFLCRLMGTGRENTPRPAILCFCLAALLLLLGGYLYALPTASVTNPFSTGIVDISLTEYQLNEETGEEEAWEDNPLIVPGLYVSKIPRISCLGNACYVRARVSFAGTTELSVEDLEGISADWVLAADGYYYYTGILETGESVDLFSGIRIPEDFSQTEEGYTFSLTVDADAIQSQNFSPDFTAANPWGAVTILECQKDSQGVVSAVEQVDSCSLLVEYQGEANVLIANPEDFFVNFPVLLPGDTYSDTAVLHNDSDEAIRLYFYSQALDTATDLLDQICLSIQVEQDGEQILVYDGSLRGEAISETQLLTTIPAGESADFVFTIYVPAELDNVYTVLNSEVSWIFSTEPIAESKITAVSGGKTGDYRRLSLLLLVLGAALLILALWEKPTAFPEVFRLARSDRRPFGLRERRGRGRRGENPYFRAGRGQEGESTCFRERRGRGGRGESRHVGQAGRKYNEGRNRP